MDHEALKFWKHAAESVRLKTTQHERVLSIKVPMPSELGLCHLQCTDGYCHVKYMGFTEAQARKV